MKQLKSILLIEDNINDQSFFIRALREIENTTLYDIASDGQEALEILEKAVVLPDLIFTDINMPVMNGIECLTEILKNPRTQNIPVVILSTATEYIESVRKLGARAFVKKPVDASKLREHIEHLIHLNYIKDTHIATQTFQTALSEVNHNRNE